MTSDALFLELRKMIDLPDRCIEFDLHLAVGSAAEACVRFYPDIHPVKDLVTKRFRLEEIHEPGLARPVALSSIDD